MLGTFLRYPEGKKKAVTLSFDDGNLADRRLISILDAYGIKSTFNLNSNGLGREEDSDPCRRMSQREQIAVYENSPHEVAIHGLAHIFPDYVPEAHFIREFLQDRENLEKTYHRIIRGMAYPFGCPRFGRDKLMPSLGFAYARSTVQNFSTDLPQNWYLWDPTAHILVKEQPEVTEKFLQTEVNGAPKLLFYWGHSTDIVRRDAWGEVERFAEAVGNRKELWYATNIEICDYARAFSQLITDTACTMAYNPTAIDLWVECHPTWILSDAYTVKVPAGQTVALR